jgi:ABC-type bacteriocin/lantibiotic exporter with double-glycine peptidase domain
MFSASSIKEVTPVRNLLALPNFCFQFFLKNMGRFKRAFLLLSGIRVASVLLRFWGVYLLGDLITNLQALTTERLLWFYLPAYLFSATASELLDYFTRRYGETLPQVYGEHLTLRFYQTLLNYPSRALNNIAKERLSALIGRYVSSVQEFINDWTWNTVSKIANLVLVLIILALQDIWVLAFNLGYIALFLGISFRYSREMAQLARGHSQQIIKSSAATSRLALNMGVVRRLGIRDFFVDSFLKFLQNSWDWLERKKAFHAKRWLIQLNLFNFLYIGTLFYGALQIIDGQLNLGYLVLIKFAFDQLWGILVYAIEYYMELIHQREDAKIIREEFQQLLSDDSVPRNHPQITHAAGLSVHDLQITFPAKDSLHAGLSIRVPEFSLRRGERVAICGPSGGGKSSLLLALLNLLPYSGKYLIDEQEVGDAEIQPSALALVCPDDPLFLCSLKENITLGRTISEQKLQKIIDGCTISDFTTDLDVQVGSTEFNLSTGQLQRIRLARCLATSADVYLLDEPFSGIDAATRERIIDFLINYLGDAALLIVTHQKEDLRLAQRCYYIQDGCLVPG